MRKNPYKTVGMLFIYISIGLFILGGLMFIGAFPYALFKNANSTVLFVLNAVFKLAFWGWFPVLFIGICIMIISPLGKK
jgi:hypothetical protein